MSLEEKISELNYKYKFVKNNKYWKDLADEINNYCNLNNINYINYFYHKELVEKKKEGN